MLVFIIFIGIILLIPISFKLFYQNVNKGEVIIKNGKEVSFSNTWLIPFLHKKEIMDISLKKIQIIKRDMNGLVCKDNLKADIKITFFLKVNHTKEDVLKVSELFGIKKASDIENIMNIFNYKFSNALKITAKKFDFVELYTKREEFKFEFLNELGTDLNGYKLEDFSIDYLEQTAKEFLDSKGLETLKKILNKN